MMHAVTGDCAIVRFLARVYVCARSMYGTREKYDPDMSPVVFTEQGTGSHQ